MSAVLILTQGPLARELLNAAATIAGDLPAFHSLSLDWNEGLESARAKVAAEIVRIDDGTGVLILTDMYGSTPTNAALAEAVPGRIEILSGVNLPMVLRLGCAAGNQGPVEEIARWLEIKGRRSISRARPGDSPAPAPGGSPCAPEPGKPDSDGS